MGTVLSTTNGTTVLFPPKLMEETIQAVQGKSALAKLSASMPVAFNGQTEFVFNLDSEVAFAVQSYGENLLDTMTLNEAVKTAMDRLTELPEVASSRLNSDYPFHDEERRRYRYQAVYDLTHY